MLIICSAWLRLPFGLLSRRVLHHFTWLICATSLSCCHTHLHSVIIGALARNTLIRCWINNLREISFSSNFLAGARSLLLRRLRIYLLLLHGVVLGAVVYWQLIHTGNGDAILVRTNRLIMLRGITWSVLPHHVLNLTLIIVKRRGWDSRFISWFRPQSVN